MDEKNLEPESNQGDLSTVAVFGTPSSTSPFISNDSSLASPLKNEEVRHRNHNTIVVEPNKKFSCGKYIRKRLPILKWLPNYKVADMLPDFVAGITVGLTAIPQSMAYANIAGLTPEFGLYSSFVPSFVYIFLGSCIQTTIGPTAIMELLVYETCGQDFPSCVILTGFYVGIIQLLMGILKIGAVVTLISDAVTIGFVGGAAAIICSSQFKSFLGLSGPKGDGFVGAVKETILNIETTQLWDSILGVACVIALLIMKNLKDYIKPSTTTRSGLYISKLLWLMSISRNAIVVIVPSIIAASLTDPPFALTGEVKKGFPPVHPPDFELHTFPSDNNSTSINGTLTFWETWGELKTTPLTVAVISILQNVAVAKAFGSGQSIDATQEMIALGAIHIVGSFFSGIPTAGSFTRSAVNEASGVRSPLGGIFTGLLVIFALSFLTRWFAYIPKASLAAMILCAVLPMIEFEALRPMWKVSKLDVVACIVTFFASLFLGMEYGIIIGVGVSLALYLIRPVRPRIEWTIINETSGEDEGNSADKAGLLSYHLLKPEQGFTFPSVDAIRTKINKSAIRYPHINIICLDCEHVLEMDYTSVSALTSLVNALKKNGKRLVFLNCKDEWVEMMVAVGMKKPDCYENLDDLERKNMHKDNNDRVEEVVST